MVLISAIQQSGHFGMTANNSVEAAERPILLDRCLMEDLEDSSDFLTEPVLMRGMKAIRRP
jgi:hypothetical protein